MGKITAKDTEDLLKSEILTDESVAELKGMISKGRQQTVKRFIKTADNKWVEPKLYFRGAKGVEKSKKMESFISDYNVLLEKYTTTRNNK
jgi:hypothetical protein|tara:strand:+ start:2147 stop:2416 length:270 start_codon:yes stop_codon:yes gene_type:complete